MPLPRLLRAGLTVLLLVAVTGCSTPVDPAADPGTAATSGSPAPAVGTGPDGQVRLVTVGDVACAPGEPVTETTCQQQATADLTARLDPGLVLGLGDLQYEEGTTEQYDGGWERSWGRFADSLLTVPGNHEWRDDLEGWRETFGATVPSAHRVGDWGVYLLDGTCEYSECFEQADWLRGALADDRGRCQLVAWHQPRATSGPEREYDVDALWQAAVDGGADVALAAHDHLYERFTHLGADALPTGDGDGVREFVVGTGGKSLYDVGETAPGSEVRVQDTFGVLELTLVEGSYAWRFVDVDDRTLDAGDDTCR